MRGPRQTRSGSLRRHVRTLLHRPRRLSDSPWRRRRRETGLSVSGSCSDAAAHHDLCPVTALNDLHLGHQRTDHGHTAASRLRARPGPPPARVAHDDHDLAASMFCLNLECPVARCDRVLHRVRACLRTSEHDLPRPRPIDTAMVKPASETMAQQRHGRADTRKAQRERPPRLAECATLDLEQGLDRSRRNQLGARPQLL